ncbi:unnamed protein product, partial [Iphiclides podalirius]
MIACVVVFYTAFGCTLPLIEIACSFDRIRHARTSDLCALRQSAVLRSKGHPTLLIGWAACTAQHSWSDVRARNPSLPTVPTVAAEEQLETARGYQAAVPIMKLATIISFGLLVAQPCVSRSVSEEDSVVSVYTKQPGLTEGTRTSGVYLIASSIAGRITSPITKFFGFGKKENATTTARPFHRIELMDDVLETATKADMNPLSNEIPRERDVEELSPEGKVKKANKKPEKITLYSSYLPTNDRIELNDTVNEIGSGDEEPFGFDDDFDDVEPKTHEGGIVYILEIIGSIIQLLWGGFLSLFQPSKSS